MTPTVNGFYWWHDLDDDTGESIDSDTGEPFPWEPVEVRDGRVFFIGYSRKYAMQVEEMEPQQWGERIERMEAK